MHYAWIAVLYQIPHLLPEGVKWENPILKYDWVHGAPLFSEFICAIGKYFCTLGCPEICTGVPSPPTHSSWAVTFIHIIINAITATVCGCITHFVNSYFLYVLYLILITGYE